MRRLTKSLLLANIVLASFTMFAHDVAAQGQPLLYTVPFKSGDGRYLIYRIPALWTAPKKPLLAFSEGRVSKRRAAGNIDIVLRRSFDLGQTWEPLQVVADFGDDFCGNPCVVRDPGNNRIFVAFTRSAGSAVEEGIAAGTSPPTTVWIAHSDDDGATWSAPRDISATCRKPNWGWYGTGPGLGLFLGSAEQGRLLIPAYHSDGGNYRAHCFYSDDHGATWQLGADAADHTSEPQVVVMPDGSLLMNARTIAGQGEKRTLLSSHDKGHSWQPAANQTALIDNHCQGCLYRGLGNGTKDHPPLIYTQPNSRKRVDVQAWLSEDEGKTWPFTQNLWHGPGAYTATVQTDDGLYCTLIECGKKDTHEQIVFLKYSAEWLKGRKSP